MALEKIVNMFQDIHQHSRQEKLFIIFDEIQYLPKWEIHLKSLVDSYSTYQFIATGSAAAALKLKSKESGGF
jgi:predicted AAA+ superfamily ATPase